MTTTTPSATDQGRPWWRYAIVWLVISGPTIVVVAALATAWIAVRNVDPVLDTSISHVGDPSEAPAMKARNHAAAPGRLVDDTGSHKPAER